MCGIAGFVGEGTREQLDTMVSAIRHRGPDHAGVFVKDGVSLGHARLSIIDTSAGAHQPMVSADGRYALVFNGEIYNFQELRDRAEQRGYRFVTSSDTEVILALYAQEGTDCFAQLSGMFAIAIYDFAERTLVLTRDRMGEKPLYWSLQNNMLSFASELSALMEARLVRKEIDHESLQMYLQLDYVPTPRTILRDVHKLEPATILVYKDAQITKQTFWRPPHVLSTMSEDEAVGRLDTLLSDIVKRELISDVPLGVFLSGGLDSSTIAYYAQKNSDRPIETFSIEFDDPSFDESSYARAVAQHLSTDHHEARLTAHDALELIPSLGDVLSEQMADASILPTLLLSRFTRSQVTVALGGDGADELFAGYPTFKAESAYQVIGRMPRLARDAARRMLDALPASHAYMSSAYGLKKVLASHGDSPMRRHLEWIGSFNPTSSTQVASDAHKGSEVDIAAPLEELTNDFAQSDAGNRLLYSYARGYLMDEVLVKVDRASMHYALETRAPFLDHAIVDLAFSLPYDMKYRRGTTKYVLKKLMREKLPEGIANRHKHGFAIPLARWLSNDLKPLRNAFLSADVLAAHGLFDAKEVHAILDAHDARRADNRKEIWNLMVFQMWYERWMR